MRTRDAIVVGAGPAGAAAAITMAEAGLDVELLDKATFPRDKVCGDGITALALRLLEELGVEPLGSDVWQWIDGCTVRSPSGRSVHLPISEADGHHVAVVPRFDLDAAIVDRARGAGAHLSTGSAVVSATQDRQHVEVRLQDGSAIRARWVVAADGMWSPMRKFLGVAEPGYLGEWHAFRQYFTNVTGPAGREMTVFFEPDLLPGYFWAFPLPHGRANVGFGIQRGSKVTVREMRQLWEDLLARPHVAAALGDAAKGEDRHRAWPIPARVDRLLAAEGRTMFVGDAVGACDVMTGEGIGQALLSGMLAGREVVDDGPDGHDAARRYSASVRSELVADHRMSALLVRALRHRKGARAAVRVVASSAWTRRNFGRWLFEDYPRAVVVTPGRWSRKMFTPPGSFVEHL